ncbi:winged helix-turn-helix transcriptional regulator [Ensifer adhaerens]|uniref:winged helix-turn-helix transcriptional regulator n=1 Tax=Ensifer adhaerens TaxID=106592 RepID=UPI00132EF2E5|nr:helix-turn-helix domain-containing protein [Ensifer adhaerens]QHG74962.1 helix-turn-helix transcriptional regulator [Ensifer adhaerens]
MQRKTFSEMNCSIARSLDEIGEWWTLLIVRECFLGTARFDQFQERLGIARNILTARLKRLIEIGVVEKVSLEVNGRREGYRLTAKGEELFPVLVALQQWGDKWAVGAGGPPIQMVEHTSGQPIGPVGPTSSNGRLLNYKDIRLEVGPGAGASTKQRITERNLAVLGVGESA